MVKTEDVDMRRVSYEIFIILMTFLSLFNLLIIVFAFESDTKQVALTINKIISAIFFADFLVRIKLSPSRMGYFLHKNGWLDLIGAVPIPGFNVARSWRIFAARKALQRDGMREIVKHVAANRAQTALIFIAIAVMFLLEFGSLLILRAELNAPHANIITAQDAIWWVLVTISTVGYGDYYPVTSDGRFVAVFVIIAGVGVFGTLSGYLAKIFLGAGSKEVVHNQVPQGLNTDPGMEEIVKLLQINLDQRDNNNEKLEALHERMARLEKLMEERFAKH